MEATSEMGDLRPRLKKCRVLGQGTKLIVESMDHESNLVLPKDYFNILTLLDGNRTVKQIVSELYRDHGKVSFNSVMTTIDLLNKGKLLEPLEYNLESDRQEKTPVDQKPSVLIRPFWETTLIRRLAIKFDLEVVFALLVAFIVTSVLVLVPTGFFEFNWDSFLKINGQYYLALPVLFVVCSALMTLKTLTKVVLLLLFTRQAFHLSLRVSWCSVSLGISDNSIFSQEDRLGLIGYGLASSMMYLFWAMIFGQLFPESSIVNEVKLISIILTFIELDPYRKSELTKFFHYFYAEDSLKNMMPYLKNCSLFSLFYQKEKIQGELRYIVYSILAMTWAVVFVNFSIDLIVANFPSLILELKMGGLTGKVSALFVLLLLFFIFAYLFIDLAHTFFGNIINPLFIPLFRMIQKRKTQEYAHFETPRIKEMLKENLFFQGLSDGAMDLLLQGSSVKKFTPGAPLIIQGSIGQEVFVILRGEVEVRQKISTGARKTLATLRTNSVVGEMAVIKETERSASVVATQEVEALEIKGSAFKKLFSDGAFREDYDRLLQRIEICHYVSSAGMFRDFPPEVINLFLNEGETLRVGPGQEVVKQGDVGDAFYLLVRGKVEVIKGKEIVAHLGQGDFFGEWALITNSPRSATVKTLEDCVLLRISGQGFWNILSHNLGLAMYIEAIGNNRMQEDGL